MFCLSDGRARTMTNPIHVYRKHVPPANMFVFPGRLADCIMYVYTYIHIHGIPGIVLLLFFLPFVRVCAYTALMFIQDTHGIIFRPSAVLAAARVFLSPDQSSVAAAAVPSLRKHFTVKLSLLWRPMPPPPPASLHVRSSPLQGVGNRGYRGYRAVAGSFEMCVSGRKVFTADSWN